MKDKSNVLILDSLRAFAALSVCSFHFICTVTGYIQTKSILNLFSIGKYGVQLFFVISGFIIPYAMYQANYQFKHFFQFLFKRLLRLEPPYVFSILLAIVILFLRQHLLGKDNTHIEVSFKQVALHFGYLIPFFKNYQWLNQVYWTLAIEFQYYILIAVLFIPFMKAKPFIRGVCYVSIILLSLIFSQTFIFYWLPIFTLGILLFLYKVNKIEKIEYYSVTVVLISFCFYAYPLFAVIYSIVPLVCILIYGNLEIPILTKIGKFSYSLYLVHPIIGASLINILSHNFTSPFQKVLVILSGFVVTILGSLLMYHFVERPSKRLSSSIKYSQTNLKN